MITNHNHPPFACVKFQQSSLNPFRTLPFQLWGEAVATSDVQRKLTAILSADVVGYSRLMGDDPEGTLKPLTEYREVFSDKIQEYKGRVVNASGDSILGEFGSVADAVEGAAEIQRELAERNAEFLEERRMLFRLGVNLRDMILRDSANSGHQTKK